MSVSQSRASRRLGVANPLRAGTTPPYAKGESWPSAGFPPVKLVSSFPGRQNSPACHIE